MNPHLNILLVEDDENDAELVIYNLKHAGLDIDVQRVMTAAEMKNALENRSWDAIISDYKLPGFNAPAALAIVKECGKDLPFIVVSGTIGEETAVEMMKAGAHDYVMKDHLNRLPEALRRELREAETRAERRRAENALRESQQRLKKRLEQLTVLHNIDLAITSFSDENQTETTILEQISHVIGVDAAALLVPSSLKRDLVLSAQVNIPKEYLPQGPEGWEDFITSANYHTRGNVFLTDLNESQHPAVRLLRTLYQSCAVLPLQTKHRNKGTLVIFSQQPGIFDQDWQYFLHSLALQTSIAIENAELFRQMQAANQELTQSYDATISGWSQALELRDEETKGHSVRVMEMSLKLAPLLGIRGEELVHFKRGVLLHDIGKMGIPDEILLKPGPLNDDEWEIMRQHSTYAYQLLSPIPFLQPAIEIPYCHHEKWDGTGYPRHLKGEEIPLSARIFSIVDVWDALTSNRPYRSALPKTEVQEYLSGQSGRHFDPQVVSTFMNIVNKNGLN